MSTIDSVATSQAIAPTPIDEGLVKQVLVEYIGEKRGTFSMTGRPSGRSYGFAAGPGDNARFVLFEDAEHFRLFADFRVRDDVIIDPARDRLDALEAQIAELARRQDTPTAPPKPQKPTGRQGRPPISVRAVQELWHLRNHCYPGWSIQDLLTRSPVESWNPTDVISARLSRFKKRSPELTKRETCPFCAADQYPIPPSNDP